MTAHLSFWAATPFVGLLIAVSVLEMVARNWWDRLRNKAIVAGVAALLAITHLIGGYGSAGAQALTHSVTDYLSFIVLLTALFVIAGGIEVKGSLSGTPLANMTMLAIGAVLANLIGTTGAAMVLIRPFLRANEHRKHRAHLVVFFILVVANAGGLLTPIGDPPLYLGFLKGVPFGWTLNLWLPWLFVNGIVLVVFFLVDRFMLRHEERAKPSEGLPLRVSGWRNIALLAGVVAVILAKTPLGLKEILLGGLALVSYLVTPRGLHERNHFSARPMAAVAIVFFGIFATMTAPLQLLNTHGAALGISERWQFFWASGVLSSILDNAPTYLCMTAIAAGRLGVPSDDSQFLATLLTVDGGAGYLAAISCGAVMMGCLTYLGNGPNLMVKEIAEHRGIAMPHFFAYAGIAMLVMLPVFVAATFLFFRQA